MPQPAYINSGAEDRATVSSGGVSGLTIPMPASLVVGNFLLAMIECRPSQALVPSQGWNDDTLSVTGSGVWNLLVDAELAPGYGCHTALYGKHVTGGEGDLKALMTAVGAGGNGKMVGVVHQFSNVANPGTATYFEGYLVTGRGAASGPIFDQDMTASGPQRLLCNVVGTNAGQLVSTGPTGETSGKWVNRWYSSGGLPRACLWTCSDSSVGGGSASSGSPANSAFNMLGFALAPCSVDVGNPALRARRFHHYLMMANQ